MKRRTVIKSALVTGAALGISKLDVYGGKLSQKLSGASHQIGATEKDGIQFWVESSLIRVYPNSSPGNNSLQLLSARNERISFQACFRNTNINSAIIKCELDGAENLEANIRRVGFVPMENFNTYTPKDELEGKGFIPGLCPEPLYQENTANIGPLGNGVFWISLVVPKDIKPGIHDLKVRFTLENEYAYVGFVNPKPWSVELPVSVDIRPLVIEPRKDFHVTQWTSADSIWEWYKIEPLGERFWELAEAYIKDLIIHNVDVIYTPIFNTRLEKLKRPAQLLGVKRVSPDKYEFDFSHVRRWVNIALKHGAGYLEFSHFFTPAPNSAQYPQHIFEGDSKNLGPLLWPRDISATSDTYRKFLQQFLPKFKEFLIEEKILNKSFFHCADEPDGDVQIANYRKARALLQEIAPWMKVMDAMSDPRYATEHLTDMPVASISTAPEFGKADCPHWVYFCCGPRDSYLQRLLDTPLPKIRMAGWLFYKLGPKGFLHWGYNYWYKFVTSIIGDPFTDASCGAWPGLPYGDPFEVYPGPNGPLDSVRWEVFSESLQDYALLQSAGIDPNDPILSSIKDYKTFPKTINWLKETREKVLERS